jgi:hypothetical protein
MKAFPIHPSISIDRHAGMDLRDYFAAKAMQKMIGVEIGDEYSLNLVVTFSYEVADAMMKAREQK